ncbi:MAG: multicopper oxidase domain-containing protein [Dehalococcoidia bacterium]
MNTTNLVNARRLDRRHFLGAAALGAAGVGLAACGDNDNSSQAAVAPTPTVAVPLPSGELAAVRDATLPPVSNQRTIDLKLEATDVTYEVAANVRYKAWTFGGTVPAPVLHLRQGDTVNFQLLNSSTLGHSIDFHAAQVDWEANYRTIQPGETIEFTWTADVPGAFMYHCGTPTVLHHIGNGMYGAVIVEPQDGYPEHADREFWLVQSEFYLQPTDDGEWTGDLAKMKEVRPDFLAWNGTAFQYRDQPLQAKVGERIRFHVVNAGPTLWSAFHVIGALFDVVYVGGHPANPMQGLQTHTIAPGDGATCDVTIPAPGKYPIVTHNFAFTELGIVGVLEVTE